MMQTDDTGQQNAVDAVVRRALDEDVGSGDITSLVTIDESAEASARFIAKADGVLSGTGPASRAFEMVRSGLRVDWFVRDGEAVTTGMCLGEMSGNARAMLTAERTALNILQRMSGIATLTARMTAETRPHRARILDTRKTAPGLRSLDKMAVRDGGGVNHRIGLYDMILIKDNHIVASGSITRALENAREFRDASRKSDLMIEIEARTLEEVREVVAFRTAHGVPDRILLDNMAKRTPDGGLDVSMLRQAVALIGGRMETEASGNVELATVQPIAATGVDFISSGALTHSVNALDISLEFTLHSRRNT